jgi:hypothetical protein
MGCRSRLQNKDGFMDINLEEKKEEKKVQTNISIARDLGLGVDVGTMTCVSAISKNKIASFKVQRDAFFDNDQMSKNMLAKLNANYIESEDKKRLYIIGEEAFNLANFFNQNIRRPLAKGVISTHEKEALSMIKVILHALIGDPIQDDEVCHFSVPGVSIDAPDQNVIYHTNILKSFISSFGFKAIPLNEAFAITLAELEDEGYMGLSLSFGAGMVNCALSFLGISNEKHQFSLSRAGDWIDAGAGAAVGLNTSRITAIKEAGIDLLNPKNREETAIKIYYEHLINYVCNALEKKLNHAENIPNFPEPITVVVSGGTSKAGNFEKLFEKELRLKTLPFKIKQVKIAKDQLTSVAKGCLLNSLNYNL